MLKIFEYVDQIWLTQGVYGGFVSFRQKINKIKR